ncbi:hypothetical protein PVAND_015326 [Polypedilum vanderplanki]|uniref:Secreted protein n=1 Tax=Polypedilum vanderplanki TaxID=319348 RepID=A0A9J6BCG6_POLVA|nr:hypothetical protein PVAND_015326 [Polypedilum vanderplanki]
MARILSYGFILFRLIFTINAGGPSEQSCTDFISQFNSAFGNVSSIVQDICDSAILKITDLDASTSSDVFEKSAHEIASDSIGEIYIQFDKVIDAIGKFMPGISTHDIFTYFITGSTAEYPLNCYNDFQSIFIDLVNECFTRVNSYINDLSETHPL